MAHVADILLVSNESNKSSEDYTVDHFARKPLNTKKVPHYLRASTGSCHDACKYGHPHKVVEKLTRPARRRMSASLADAERTIDIEIYVDKKVQKRVQPVKVESQSSKELALPNGNSKKSLPSSMNSPVRGASKVVKQGLSTSLPSSKFPKVITKVVQSSPKSSLLSDTSKIPKKEIVVKKIAPLKRIPLSPKERNAMVGPSKLNSRVVKPPSLSDTLKTSNRENASVANKCVSSSKREPLIPKARNSSENPLKSKGKDEKTPSSIGYFTKSRGKQASDTKGSLVKTAASSASTLSLRSSKGAAKTPLHPKTTGISLKGRIQGTQVSAKSENLASKAEQKEAADDHNLEEKALHMIVTKEGDMLKTCNDVSTTPNAGLLVQAISPLSSESLNSSSQGNSLSFTCHEVDDDLDSEYADSETDYLVSNYNNLGNSKPTDILKGEEVTGDSDGPMKLKFRMGTVAEHHPENNCPTKLQFRQGRVLDDDQSAHDGTQQKSYSNRAANVEKKESDTGVVKVVLKHQEVETKKDEQVSLNNVIEETASKLVEKRKSKVKALVGAFESVISLQVRKPSAANR